MRALYYSDALPQTFHFILFLLHAGSAAAMLAKASGSAANFAPPTITLGGRSVGQVNLLAMNGSFLACTAAAHLLYFSERVDSIRWRWFEYSLSASIMAAEIAILSGTRDLVALIAIAGLIASTMRFGRLQDCSRGPDSPFWHGMVPYSFAWLALIIQYSDTVLHSKTPVPGFVHPIFFITFAFFSSFAIVQLRYKVLTNDIKRQDIAMHFLSLASKLTLAWWVYGGITARRD
jgi:hypothetical protein